MPKCIHIIENVPSVQARWEWEETTESIKIVRGEISRISNDPKVFGPDDISACVLKEYAKTFYKLLGMLLKNRRKGNGREQMSYFFLIQNEKGKCSELQAGIPNEDSL